MAKIRVLRTRVVISSWRQNHVNVIGDQHPEEIDMFRVRFSRVDGRRQIPTNESIDFALASARSQEEICRLRRDDIDCEKMTALDFLPWSAPMIQKR